MPLPPRDPEEDANLYAYGGAGLPSTLGESLQATVADPLLRPTEQLLDAAKDQILAQSPRVYAGKGGFVGAEHTLPGAPVIAPDAKPPEVMQPEQIAQEFGHLGVKFDEPTPRPLVESVANRRREMYHREEITAAGPGGIVATGLRFGAGFLGSAFDPLNIAAGFIPVAGEANIARLGLGPVASRALLGAEQGAIGTGAIEFPNVILAKHNQLDYDMGDALLNIGFGTILGGGLHVFSGAVHDKFAPRQPEVTRTASPEAMQGAMEAAVSQTAQGNQVNVAPIFAADAALRDASQAKTGAVPDLGGEVDSLMSHWQSLKAAGPGRPRADDPHAFTRKFLAERGITPDMSEAQARTAAEAWVADQGAARNRAPLSEDEKAQAIAPHMQEIKGLAYPTTDWTVMPTPETTVEFNVAEAERLDTEALDAIEREVVAAREEPLPVAPEIGQLIQEKAPTEAGAKVSVSSPISPPKETVGGTLEPYTPKASEAIPAGKVGPDGEAGVFQFDASKLKVDAKRFQFKAGGDEFGVTEKLKNIKTFSRTKAGQLIVWEDLKGDVYVANGHQRVGLAKRVKANNPEADTTVSAVLYREKDGVTAHDVMAIAAAANVAEGSGSVIDMAKIARLRPELMGEALRVSDEKQRMAFDLTHLNDSAWGMVVNEVAPYQYAALVGRLLPEDAARQNAALDLLAKAKPSSLAQAESLVRQVRDEALQTETQSGLFGEEEIAKSLAIEKSKVEAAAESLIRQDRRVFNTLVKESERIQGAGNVLNAEENAARAGKAGEIIQTIKALAYRKGPISDALTKAAQEVSQGIAPKTAARRFIDAVRSSDALGRAAGGEPGAPQRAGNAAAANIGNEGPDGKQIVGTQYDATPDDLVASISEAKDVLSDADMAVLVEALTGAPKIEPNVKSLAYAMDPLIGESISKMADKYGLSMTAETGLGHVVEDYQQGMWQSEEALANELKSYLGPKYDAANLAQEIVNEFGPAPVPAAGSGEGWIEKTANAPALNPSSPIDGQIWNKGKAWIAKATDKPTFQYGYGWPISKETMQGEASTLGAAMAKAKFSIADYENAKLVKGTSPPPTFSDQEIANALKLNQEELVYLSKDETKRRALYGENADQFPSLENEKARQDRRVQMGYTQLAFRGGQRPPKFATFGMRARDEGQPGAVFFAEHPTVSNKYAGVAKGGVSYPVWLRTKGFLDISWPQRFGAENYSRSRMNALIKEARQEGYPGIIARNINDVGGLQTQYVVLDNSAIRGWFARFDPEERFNGDYMASIGDKYSAGGTVSRDPMLIGAEARQIEREAEAAVKPKIALVQGEIPPLRPRIETINLAASIVRRLPPEITVRLNAKLAPVGGRSILGGYSSSLKTLYLTAKSLDPVATLRHEEVHVLRDLGLFSDKEWGVLGERADKLRADFGIDEKYRDWFTRRWPNDPARVEQALQEEAIAHMVESYQGGTRYGGAVDRILQAIIDFFDRLRNAARGLGFQNADDVISRIESGEIGGRGIIEGQAQDYGLAARLKDLSPDEKDLYDLLQRKATVDEIQAHPLIQRFIREAEQIPDRSKEAGYGSDAWKSKAEYFFKGERVVGWNNAVERLVDNAKAYAQGPVRAEHRAVIMLGPPAAGKSSIAEELAPMLGAAIPDPDDAKKIIPGFNDGIGSSAVHEESGHLSGYMMQDLMDEGSNMIIPKVGSSAGSIKGITDRLHKAGYHVEIVLMEVDDAEAFRRSIMRFISTGRLITPKYMVEDVDGRPRLVYKQLENEKYGEAFATIDNNGALDAPRRITGTALQDIPGIRGSGNERYLGGNGSESPGEAETLASIKSELTPAGEQLVIPGAEKISDKQLAERKTQGAKKATAPQKGTADLPLFGGYQADLVDLARLKQADEAVQKADDLEASVMQAARCMNFRGLL